MGVDRIESQLMQPSRSVDHPGVCAVMVTYNPGASFVDNVRALIPQVGRLIIVDNQSGSAGHDIVLKAVADFGVEVIWNRQNFGIAGGLNLGIERARSTGKYEWIATFDQDSLVPCGFVAHLLDAYEACPFREQVAVVGATYSNPVYEQCGQSISTQGGPAFRELKTVMTSGSLLKTSAFTHADFDESLFMDYVDHDFCLRMRRYGRRIIQATSAILAHQLGSPSLHRFLGKPFLTSNHSSSRRYHNARNRLVVYRKYLTSEPSWVLADFLGWAREMLKVALVETNRKEKLLSVVRGIRDAMDNGRKTP